MDRTRWGIAGVAVAAVAAAAWLLAPEPGGPPETAPAPTAARASTTPPPTRPPPGAADAPAVAVAPDPPARPPTTTLRTPSGQPRPEGSPAPTDWDAVRAEAADAWRASAMDAARTYAESLDAPTAAAVVGEVASMVDATEAIRGGLRRGDLSPADGRAAITATRDATRARLVERLGADGEAELWTALEAAAR
jgi:hypothetical protein